MIRVAIVSIDNRARRDLARYVTKAGFDVHELEDIPLPSGFAGLVLIENQDTPLLARLRPLLRLTRRQVIVVITSKPASLHELVAAHSQRLVVLAAPAFGWDVVDALRATVPPPRASGA